MQLPHQMANKEGSCIGSRIIQTETLTMANFYKLFIALAAAQLLIGCATRVPERISDQSTLAVLWLQNAGEYEALCYQAFNAGKNAVDQAAAAEIQQWAVVVDIDETMLDNSPYAAWLLMHQASYTPETWAAWCAAAEAPAIPGALDFANYVTEQGGALFYVSNRTQDTLNATMQNLRELNFPTVNSSQVLLQTDSSNKQERLQRIMDAGYQIVLLVGDNLNDFPELGTWHRINEKRNQATAAHQSDFGQRFIILPNPSYGDWERGFISGYYGLSAEEKLQVRRENLKPWSGN
jgi:5'-nucleotidase (lipoprotein e(P4) family)